MGVHGHPVASDTVHNDLSETNTELTAVNTKLDAANTKLQAIADNTDTLEVNVAAVNVNTDTLEALIASTNTKTDTGNASLSSVDSKLTSQATGAKQDTGNTSLSSIDSKASLQATAAKQDTQTTAITLLHTDNGNEGSAPPTLNGAGAAGILGYLRNTEDKLVTIASQMTSGAQLTKITNGTQTADTAAGDSGQNVQLVGGGIKTTAIASATVVVDCATYRYVAFQLINTGSITPQQSDDNSTWVSCPYFNTANSPTTITTGSVSGSAGHYQALIGSRYFRILYNSGTITGSIIQSSVPFGLPPSVLSVTPSGTFTVAQGAGSATPWPVAGSTTNSSNVNSTTAVAGSSVDLTACFIYWNCLITVGGTGSLSALSVVLEGSIDGATWGTIATYSTTTTGYTTTNTTPMPFRFVRTRIATLTAASGTPSVTTKIGAV